MVRCRFRILGAILISSLLLCFQYTTWRSNSIEFYTKVQVRKCFQNGDEKVVKLILSPAQIANAEFTDKIMNEYVQFSDHFRVYVQALISQSLHNDFLSDVGDDGKFGLIYNIPNKFSLISSTR